MSSFLRPIQSHWFETYVPREQTVRALQVLADTGRVELELDPRSSVPLDLRQLHKALEEFHRLSRRYRPFLPDVETPFCGPVDTTPESLEQQLDHLRDWSERVDAVAWQLEPLERERRDLLLLGECLVTLRQSSDELVFLSHSTRFLDKGVYACPRECDLSVKLEQAVDLLVPGPKHNFFIVAGLPESARMALNAYRYVACTRVRIPDWLPGNPDLQRQQVTTRIRDVDGQLARIRERLAELRQDREVVGALASIGLLEWYLERADDLAAEQTLCHVTGWTGAEDLDILQRALQRAGIGAVIRLANAPLLASPPVQTLRNWWSSPFRQFLAMLGTPGKAEVDPTGLLPFVVSLLFGYMFPDVGHGLVLALFALLMWRRWPDGRFLIPCGLSAAAFGVVFGEVFGLHELIPALWLKPLQQPLPVLFAPLLFGVGLMLLGLLFSGLEAHWRGELKGWLQRDAAVPVIYAALLAGLFLDHVAWLAGMALLWFLGGHLYRAGPRRWETLAGSVGQLVESLFELALNTFSFLRVGAFALAHAGLSTAILGLASGIDNPGLRILFLLLGHGTVIAIEGLVVFVQTTRLVLFEFFIRFLHADGRVFRPLPGPLRRS